MGESGMQIQNPDVNIEFELGCRESELVIKRKSENGSSSCKILGSREFYVIIVREHAQQLREMRLFLVHQPRAGIEACVW